MIFLTYTQIKKITVIDSRAVADTSKKQKFKLAQVSLNQCLLSSLSAFCGFFLLCYVLYCFLVPWFTCGQDYHWTGIYHWSLSEDEGKLPAAFMKFLWLVITCFFIHFLFSAIHRKAAEDTVSDFVSVHKRDQVYRCEVKGMIIFHSEAYVAFLRTWSEGSQIDEMVKNKKLGMKCVMSSQLSSLCEIICDLLP